jgi:PAS domain S-box-containing protein
MRTASADARTAAFARRARGAGDGLRPTKAIVEARDPSLQRPRTALLAVLLAAAVVVLFVFGFSRRRRREAAGGKPLWKRSTSNVDSHDGPALAFDASETVVAANRAALALLGYRRYELVRRPLREVVAPETWAAAQANLALALSGDAIEFDLALLARDGRRVDCSTKTVPLEGDERGSGAYLVLHETGAQNSSAELTGPSPAPDAESDS